MSKTEDMQARDKRMFGTEIRDKPYRGPDNTMTGKGEIGTVDAIDHGARPLIGKFSLFNLSYLTPKQRRLFAEQMKYELSLSADDLNKYLSERYSPEDEAVAWRIQNGGSKRRTDTLKTVGIFKPKRRKQKLAISRKKRVPLTPEQIAERTAKAKVTRERNKKDPNYVPYATLKKDFLKLQKLVAQRHEVRMKEATALFVAPTVAHKVRIKTTRLERENQRLKEYLRQNNMPLPGTRAAKKRREELRGND